MKKKDLVFLSLWSLLVLLLPGVSWIFHRRIGLFNFGDLYFYHYPLRETALNFLEKGQFPFWNPYIFGGVPLAANSQTSLFYPIAVIGKIFPLLFSFSLENLFHLWWAGLGMALLIKSQGLKSEAAWILGISYGLCPFLTGRIAEGIPTILASLAWAPWAWLALSDQNTILLSAIWALQFFSGHPQFMIINAGAMLLWAFLFRPRLKNLKILFFSSIGAALLASVQWVMTAQFLLHSIRQNWSVLYSLGYSVNSKELWSWLWPGLGLSALTHSSAPVSVVLENSLAFPGFFVLLLAGIGLWKKPLSFYTLIIGLGIFFASGRHNPAYLWLLSHTPLHFLRTPSRFSFLSLWGFFLLAGSALKSIKKPSRVPLAILAALSLFQLLILNLNLVKTQDSSSYLGPHRFFSQTLSGKPGRVLISPAIGNPDKAMMYHVMNVNGYDAFYLKGFPDYAFRSEGRPAVDASRSYLQKWNTPQMKDLGVNWAFIKPDSVLSVSPKNPLAYFVDKKNYPLSPSPQLALLNENHWEVSGVWKKPATSLVISEPFYPGWKAYWNGQKTDILPWNGFLSSISIPSASPNSFTVDFVFHPRLWPLLVLATILSWFLWFAWALKIQ